MFSKLREDLGRIDIRIKYQITCNSSRANSGSSLSAPVRRLGWKIKTGQRLEDMIMLPLTCLCTAWQKQACTRFEFFASPWTSHTSLHSLTFLSLRVDQKIHCFRDCLPKKVAVLLDIVQMRGGSAVPKLFVHFSQTVYIGSIWEKWTTDLTRALPPPSRKGMTPAQIFWHVGVKKSGKRCPK